MSYIDGIVRATVDEEYLVVRCTSCSSSRISDGLYEVLYLFVSNVTGQRVSYVTAEYQDASPDTAA